jgi:hypothetical protein
MTKTRDVPHHRIDAFVAAVNAAKREPLQSEEIPSRCRRPREGYLPEDWDSDWQIVPSTNADWLPELENRLPFRLPPTFRSLVSRYLFPSFDAGPIQFYSVGVEEPYTEFRSAVFGDRFMSPFLLKNGYVQFGRPAGGSYDPICFDFTISRRKSEPPVVHIDHEEILCNERIRVIESLSPAFHLFVEDLTRTLQTQERSK